MSKQKLKLDDIAIEDSFFEESSLVGISSVLPAYRLCWLLNRHFDVQFICEPGMTIISNKSEMTYYYPVYQYEIPDSCFRHVIYKLKSENLSILPEINAIDFLWLIQSPYHESAATDIVFKLRKLPDVLLSQKIELSQLKNVKNLIL